MKAIITGCLALVFLCGCTFHDPPSSEGAADRPPLQQAERPVSKMILTDGDRRWELDLAKVGFDGIDPTTLDRGAFFRWVEETIEPEVNQEPIPAHFEKRELKPHRDGRRVDRDQLEGWLDSIHTHLNVESPLPVQVWQPAITTKTLLRIKEKRLGSYTTRYNPYNRNRAHNILLSTQAIDHVVLPEGDVFSFNRVVGMRTPERGYKPAPIIVRGEYTEGVGGGICQTSSTLYNSVERAGLRVLQRVSHSKNVTYVPKGQDATVSWGGPDFQFQNQLNQPILVVAQAQGGWLTIDIYGPGDTNHRPRPTPEPPKEEPDVESVPPEKEQPLNRDAEEYHNRPLQQEELEQKQTEE
jgi:vancomycin resistance protein YoaR